MQKRKIAIGAILVMLLLVTVVLVQPALAKPHSAEPGDISVRQAYNMIKHQSKWNQVLILDVRNQREYNQGHLYGANLLPLHIIENWDWNWNSTPVPDKPNINFLQAHANDTIIVYCKSGARSAQACQILVDHGIIL